MGITAMCSIYQIIHFSWYESFFFLPSSWRKLRPPLDSRELQEIIALRIIHTVPDKILPEPWKNRIFHSHRPDRTVPQSDLQISQCPLLVGTSVPWHGDKGRTKVFPARLLFDTYAIRTCAQTISLVEESMLIKI